MKYKIVGLIVLAIAGALAGSAIAGGKAGQWYTTTTETCKTITQYVTTTLHSTTTVTTTVPVTTTITTTTEKPPVTVTSTVHDTTTVGVTTTTPGTTTPGATTTVTNEHTNTVTLPAQVTTVTLPAVTNTVTMPGKTTTVVRNHTVIKRLVIHTPAKPLTPKQKCLAAKANGAKWNGHTCEFRGEG